VIDQDDLSEARPGVFRLGLKIWLHKGTHPREPDEWRGEVYDQLEPRLRQAFRDLARLPEVVSGVIGRIEIGERRRFPERGSPLPGGADPSEEEEEDG
jgi:hypothetical protein